MVLAQTAPGLVNKWSGDGDGNDSVGTASCLTSNLIFTAGHSGQAFSFDGTVFPDFGSNVCVFGTSDFTIDFWIQTTQAGSVTVFSRHAWCRDFNVVECRLSDGTVSFRLSKNEDDDSTCRVQSAKTINDGTFHHVAIERRSLDLSIYIDGVLDGLTTAEQVINITTISSGVDTADNPTNAQPDFILGKNLCGANSEGQFVGALDEIEVYNRALDDTEIYWLVHPGTPIAIVNQPFNQRTLVGRSVVFHTAAIGLQPITYQWRFNGLDIPGAISNNLFIDTPLMSDSGTYYCVIDNPAGEVMTHQATLVVTNLTTPTDAIIARWSGEGSGADSIGGNDGVTHNVHYGQGVVGSSFKFKGFSYVECPGVLNSISTNDFTIDFWMMTTMTGTPVDFFPALAPPVLGDACDPYNAVDFRCGFYKPPGGASNCFVCFQIHPVQGAYPANPAGNLPALWHSVLSFPCQPDTSASPIQVNDGVFHHIAGVRKGRTVSIYLDGRWVQSATTREPINHQRTDSFFLGGYCADFDGGGFPGQLDEIQVHNRALSDSEIYSEYSPDPALVILRQPQGGDVLDGNLFSCSVLAAGMAPYSFQWQHNGTEIPGATDSTYMIAHATQVDAGTYAVVVGNALQTVTSSQAMLSVVPTNSLLPGLVNLWTADGTANDCVGHAENRTFNAVYAAGISGKAFDIAAHGATFDERIGNFGTNDFTISLWAKSLSWSHNAFPNAAPDVRNILSKSEMEVDRFAPGYALRMTNGALLFCGADAEGHLFNVANQTPSVLGYAYAAGLLDDAEFHHISVVRRFQTNIELYLDATLIAQTNMPALTTLDNNEALTLNGTLIRVWHSDTNFGFGGTYQYPFNGHLDQIELYNRALTTEEITGLYERFSNNPQVTGVLQRVEAHGGDKLTLTPQTATGPGPLSYQWTFNGVPIALATSSTLAINVDGNSFGDYALVVSNPYGSVTCPMAAVTMALSPGSYNGLFYLEDDPTDDTAGYVSLTVNTSQTYSGSILQHGKKYSFTGRFSGGQSVSSRIPRPGKSPLNLNLTIPTEATLDKISGVVNDGSHVIPLKAQRAVYNGNAPTPQAGQYTIALTGIPSATAPNGHGLGKITIASGGQVQLGANLADGTAVSQGSMVANSGEWPIYVPLYGGKGSMLGWLSFSNAPGSRVAGALRWVKAPNAGGKNYKGGFATKSPVTVSVFAPAAAGLGIDLSNYQMVLDGAKVYSAISNELTGVSGNAISYSQQNTTPGTLMVNAGLGQFSGNFIYPGTKLNIPVKGVVLQEQGEAAGYFICSNLSGRVVLKPK